MSNLLVDPHYCEHEWWQSTYIGGPYSTQVCRLCGEKRRVQMSEKEMKDSGYIKVKEKIEDVFSS